MSKQEIKSLDSREHILIRPNMYIGAVTEQKSQEYINGKLEEVVFTPGLAKIINEIIDNSVDVAIKTDFKGCNEISVKITEDCVEVIDNGTGIPVEKNKDGEYLPKVCWGTALSGSNFSDTNRTQMGMNGVGSYCTNVWSKKFVGTSDDGKNKYTITFKDNASKFTEKLDKSSKHGVTVKFWPDLERFKLQNISDTIKSIIYQRLVNLNMCFPKLKFKFNNKTININSFKKYVGLFSENFEIFETDKYQFAILPSSSDEFQQFSFVNGLKIPEGGTHIEVISNQIVSRLREKLCKKYKTLKPADIKNKLMIIAFLRDFPSPMFNSQTKEKLTNSTAELTEYYNGDCDYEAFSKKILKNSAIIDPIVEVFKIKEEFKKRQELKSLEKPKKIKNEKYTPPIGNRDYLFICEGYCLDENTEVMMSNYTSKKIKDINLNDEVLNDDMTSRKVYAMNKTLRKCLEIKTKRGSVVCGHDHRMFVYDTKDMKFVYLEAEKIKLDINRYKMVHSKVNHETQYIEVNTNVDMIINDTIHYSDSDYFLILRDGKVKREKGTCIQKNDLIMISKR